MANEDEIMMIVLVAVTAIGLTLACIFVFYVNKLPYAYDTLVNMFKIERNKNTKISFLMGVSREEDYKKMTLEQIHDHFWPEVETYRLNYHFKRE
jgi:hypothetical protein